MDRPLRIPQACDACKRRKVKCSGVQGCTQCTHLGLRCVYSTRDSLSRSRKYIVRGRVIDTYKHDLTDNSACARLARVERVPPESVDRVAEDLVTRYAGSFDSLIKNYCDFVLPMLPIISGNELRDTISEMRTNGSSLASALVHGVAAITINMTGSRSSDPENGAKKTEALYTKALELRGPLMPDHRITVRSVMIPLLVATCLFATHCNVDMAFFYLREAITGAQILTAQLSANIDSPKSAQDRQIQRLNWLLFVHERHLSLRSDRSAVLSALPCPMSPDPVIPIQVVDGFNRIIGLYKVVDGAFLENWHRSPSPTLSIEWIQQKQLELGGDVEPWENENNVLTSFQKVDLIVTRHWLRTLVWQMALSKFLLTSDHRVEQDCLHMVFPARISHYLRLVLVEMPRQIVEIHGTGIIQKITDITSTLADLLTLVLVPSSDEQVVSDYLSDFVFLYEFLSSMSELHEIERRVLSSKYEAIKQMVSS